MLSAGANAQSETNVQEMHWDIDGVRRDAMVYVPLAAKDKSTPVIFVYHGHGGNMKGMMQAHQFEKLWPEAIIVFPQGLKTPGQLVDRAGDFSGWQQGPGDENDRDIHFFDQMLNTLATSYKVDRNRIYATGHSNGGSFTYLLWAMRGDELAAVAPSAAVAFSFKSMLKPKPVMMIMGDKDPLVKPSWQKMMFNVLVNLNNCSSQGEAYAPLATLYPSPNHTPLVLYTHSGGHIYPQAAEEVVVNFFKSVVK